MKGLPFSAPMMLAWLAGRKTVTRRLINLQPANAWSAAWGSDQQKYAFFFYHSDTMLIRPRYLPGEAVYIKENWSTSRSCDDRIPSDMEKPGKGYGYPVWYAADGILNLRGRKSLDGGTGFTTKGKNRPSMFMPEWASRSKALVISARPERLQDITEEDAIAEGLSKITKDNGRVWKYGIADRDGLSGVDDIGWPWFRWKVNPVEAYQQLWDSLNASQYPWSSNPWVWRYELQKLENC